jgi:hypothetical protein
MVSAPGRAAAHDAEAEAELLGVLAIELDEEQDKL